MLRAIVAVVLQLLLVLTLSRQAAGQAAAHLDGAQTHGHAHIRAAEGSQLALDFLTLADGLLRERKRRAPHFTATVTYASLMASIRSEAEFRALYRLTHSEYIDLHKKICQHDPTYSGGQHARGLDSRLKLLSALRFLAGGDVKDVLIAHGQSRTTFWRHLEATMDAILVLYPLELNLDDPAKLAELEQCCCEGRLFDPSKSKAYRGCIGFLDGIQIEIRRPRNLAYAGDFFCQRKDRFGINCQAICDGQLRFTFFSCRCTGGTHDAAAFKMTALGQRVELGRAPGGVPAPFFFAADAAYPSGESLIVPVAGAAKDTAEDSFNYFHSAYRCTIERAFGVLVRRWGVLWRALPYSMPMNTAIIRTCVRLHNLCAERHGQQQACDVESHVMDGDQPTMLDVQSEFLDAYPNPETHRTDSSLTRTALIFSVEREGIRRQQ